MANIKGIDINEAIDIGTQLLMQALEEIKFDLMPSMSLEEINRVYVKPIDNIILTEEDKSGAKFIGGEFIISYVDDRNYLCSYRLFFQGKEQKIDELSAKSKPFSAAYLSDEARAELKKSKEIKYDIEEPTPEVRSRYEKMKAVKQ